MMEEKISCAVCRDLLPLVQDGVASEESAALVRRHLEGCPPAAAWPGRGTAERGRRSRPQRTRRGCFTGYG